jgi:hypothetical protein
MKRHILSGALAASVLLALAGPVAAWSGIGVTISGGGGDDISGTGEVIVPTLLVARTFGNPPAGDLGPKLQITYREGADGPVIAVQDLYPYAPGGPVSFSATAGEIFGHPYAAGWHRRTPRSSACSSRGACRRTRRPAWGCPTLVIRRRPPHRARPRPPPSHRSGQSLRPWSVGSCWLAWA